MTRKSCFGLILIECESVCLAGKLIYHIYIFYIYIDTTPIDEDKRKEEKIR